MIKNQPAQHSLNVQGAPIPGLGICLECLGVYKLHMNDAEKVANNEEPPPVFFAVVNAPNWMSQIVPNGQGGQMRVYAAISSPTCMMHLGVQPISPQQRAANSGLIIPG